MVLLKIAWAPPASAPIDMLETYFSALGWAYERGGATILDLLDAARTSRAIQQNYIEALFTYQHHLFQLESAGMRARRQAIQREADFHGAMDGASKFVRGDAIAGLLVVFINVIGGMIIGIAQQGDAIGARHRRPRFLLEEAEEIALDAAILVAGLWRRISKSGSGSNVTRMSGAT